MSKQLLIYENAVPISAEHHQDISIRTGESWAFARDLHSVPLVAAEFEQAGAEMPVVFAGEGDDLTPVGLLGLEAGENLFLDSDHRWQGRYVPAFLRRYPFVFASTGENGETLTLCIDTGFSGVNTEGRGERLFDADDNRTQYLERMLQFASDYQAQHQLTRAFGKRLNQLGILEPAIANISLPGGRSFTLRGFQRVNREKLAALSDEVVVDLFRTDMLGLIHFHLASLSQMNRLLERKQPAVPAPTHASEQEEPA